MMVILVASLRVLVNTDCRLSCMSMDPIELLASTHSQNLRLVCAAAGEQFIGLSFGARRLRWRLPARPVCRLVQLDTTCAVLRRTTETSCNDLVIALRGSPLDCADYSESVTNHEVIDDGDCDNNSSSPAPKAVNNVNNGMQDFDVSRSCCAHMQTDLSIAPCFMFIRVAISRAPRSEGRGLLTRRCQ